MALTVPRDIARLLDIEYKDLTYLAYKMPNKYSTFFLKKRSGGERIITVPCVRLKIVQTRLNNILQSVYEPRPAVHGFVRQQSIVTNANNHVGKKCLLNVDLKDFFPSINFGRVRGLFKAKPYNLPDSVATLLAQICCHNNQLPQGAPTSPVIANMICAKLDGELQRLAKQCFSKYTRYADDITFSTTRVSFPQALVFYDGDKSQCGKRLQAVIEANGFFINNEKVRLSLPCQRQEVNGLIVNRRTNIKRSVIKQVRAMLHAWRKYGYEMAALDHDQKWDKRQRAPGLPPPSYCNVVAGKINYIRMVRGEGDPVYRKLAQQYNQLCPGRFPDYQEILCNDITDALWVIETNDQLQGTAFMLSEVGLVTCNHCVTCDHCSDESISVFQYDKSNKKYRVRSCRRHANYDIAILKIIDPPILSVLKRSVKKPKQGDNVTATGFPNYRPGVTPYFNAGKVSGFRSVTMTNRIMLSMGVVSGMSGGPLLDEFNNVVGILVTGADSIEETYATEKNGAIPIEIIDLLYENETDEHHKSVAR